MSENKEKLTLILFFEDQWADCVKMMQRVNGRLDEQKMIIRSPNMGTLNVTRKDYYTENRKLCFKEFFFSFKFHVSDVRLELPYKEKFYLLEGSKYNKDFLKKHKKQILGMAKYNPKLELVDMELLPTA